MATDLANQIVKIQSFFDNFQISLNEGIQTSIKVFQHLLTYLKPSTPEQYAKDWLQDQIDNFINQKIIQAHNSIVKHVNNLFMHLLIKQGITLIKEDDVIITYAHSLVLASLLIKAHKNGIHFKVKLSLKKNYLKVICIDNPPFYEGRSMLQLLTQNGIQCIYTLINTAPRFMKMASKIFVGTSSVLINGSVVSRVGTGLLSCIAVSYRVPFIVLCETYKLSERSQLDALASNELRDPELLLIQSQNQSLQEQQHLQLQQQQQQQQSQQLKFRAINLRWDLTPIQNINMVVTELGKVSATSVPVIIREFKKINYIGKIEIKKF